MLKIIIFSIWGKTNSVFIFNHNKKILFNYQSILEIAKAKKVITSKITECFTPDFKEPSLNFPTTSPVNSASIKTKIKNELFIIPEESDPVKFTAPPKAAAPDPENELKIRGINLICTKSMITKKIKKMIYP